MLTYCGRPAPASFCDPFPYIDPRYARETIAEICSMRVTLATAIISQAGSLVSRAFFAARCEPQQERRRAQSTHSQTGRRL